MFECVHQMPTNPQSGTVMTFIVRLIRNDSGAIHGVIERASTGAKQAVDGSEAIGVVIADMVAAETKRKS